MMVLGFRARYGGRFGRVPVIEAGRFKLIQVKDYKSVPLPLTMLLISAKEAGADFLVIDPSGREDNKATWVDIREVA